MFHVKIANDHPFSNFESLTYHHLSSQPTRGKVFIIITPLVGVRKPNRAMMPHDQVFEEAGWRRRWSDA
jgi:hypothetical protein